MSDITFSCPNCGEVLEGTDDIVGALVECPTCETQFEVPREDAEPQNVLTAALAAQAENTDAPEAADDVCPNCSEPLAAEAVLCLGCGFHQGLGKVIETDFG